MRNEPFGITTVQAIAAGCIPIVPDSGGQREIVGNASLRYSGLDDVPKVIRLVESREQPDMLIQIRSGLGQYDRALFRKKIRARLDSFINRSYEQQ